MTAWIVLIALSVVGVAGAIALDEWDRKVGRK